MPLKVLVVDDSGFFQRRVSEIINADPRLQVIAMASNGLEGLELAKKLKPDVITMDYEMPVMDGVTAVRNIMAEVPTPVLMFSSLTYEGARVTLDALDAGAVDFLSKRFDAIAATESELHQVLTDRICEVAGSGKKSAAAAALVQKDRSSGLSTQPASAQSTSTQKTAVTTSAKPEPTASSATSRTSRSLSADVVILGTSTGGPAALQTVFKQIPTGFKTPIVIVQHMPGSFTQAFAERLNRLSGLNVKEAEDGDQLKEGHVYVAPGGKQLMLDKRNKGSIHIRDADERVSYKPSVDIALASAAKHFGAKALAVILTGMGADGKEGARLLKQAGGHIWAQDEASCVIYGMPMAVVNAGLADTVLPLAEIGERICKEAG